MKPRLRGSPVYNSHSYCTFKIHKTQVLCLNYRWNYIQLVPGNDRWRRVGWVIEINGPSRAEEFINAFLVPFSRGHRLSKEGDRALKLCALLAFPLPPPGSVVQNVDLPPRLEAVGPEQLSGVVLDLAEGYACLPSELRPNRRVIIEELLLALEELTQTPKCTWCLYTSPSCACGSVQAQAQRWARDLPEDLPPPYQWVAPTTIGSTPQPTTGTLSSHAQAPGHAYFQQTYPTLIMGAPEDPPPMWLPAAPEQGLRPTIEPCSQATATTTQRAVPRMPPPPGLTPPTTAIPALMSLTPTSGPTSSVTSTSTTHTRDTTASTGPSASSSSQRESRGCGQVRLQGSTQVGSSQAGTQQSSQSRRRRCAQSQGHSQSQRQTQTTTTSEGDRQARAPANPSSSSSAAQQASTQGDVCQEMPMDTSEVHPRDGATLTDKWGEPCPFEDEGPDMPKSEGWKADYSTFFRYFLRGHFPTYPWPSSGRFMNQSSGTWGLAGSFGPGSRRRTPCS